jgi:hypothetical protein
MNFLSKYAIERAGDGPQQTLVKNIGWEEIDGSECAE